jgi:hypothetical protein
MKKLMTLMLGMALAFGTVSVGFAQEPKKEDAPKKKAPKKAPKKDDEKKKEPAAR